MNDSVTLKIILVAGARPNFIKIAPIFHRLKKYSDLITCIVHTGQHYDENMSELFFTELDIPKPDIYLGVGSASHAIQTARIMEKFEEVCENEKPHMVIVVGDVNSTLACSLVAAKKNIRVSHVEAGLRSFDNSMPEEINRIVTDHLSHYLFVSEPSGMDNIKKEGIQNVEYQKGIWSKRDISHTRKSADKKVYFVGNVMIDSLVKYIPSINRSEILESLHLTSSDYILVTFHRPENVDSKEKLIKLMDFLNKISRIKKVVFPVHPRTAKNLKDLKLNRNCTKDLLLTEPLGYIDFLKLSKESALVITDSGGIQEETTFLGVQCVTVRDSTERPVTVEVGTNHLAGTDIRRVEKIVMEILTGRIKEGGIPELWDGRAADRIVKILRKELRNQECS